MTTPITHFVRQMNPGGPEPSLKAFHNMWAALRVLLVAEMRRRSSWMSPPSYLGIVGHAGWTSPGNERDALDELAAECFEFVFIRRLASLRSHAESKPTVDGLVVLAIRHFLLDLQRRNDPLGFRVFEVLRRVVKRLVEAERLFLVGGDERIRNNTLVATEASAPPESIREVDPSPLADAWTSSHLDGLVTATHGDLSTLIRRLADELFHWLGGERPGVQFGDLATALKQRVRTAWADRFLTSGLSAPGATLSVAEEKRKARASLDRIAALGRCVTRTIEHSEQRRATRDYLVRLWQFLANFTAEDFLVPDSATDELPSYRQLSQLLGIPRERIPGLLKTLGQYLNQCRARADRPMEEKLMPSAPPTPSPQERARAQARAALAQEASLTSARIGQKAGELRRGDILDLSDLNVPGVFWLLLEVEGSHGPVYCVAVDTFPFLGPSDQWLASRQESREPWVLRRKFELTLARKHFVSAIRVDHLDSEILAATLAGNPGEGESRVDRDLPAYRDWIDAGPSAAYRKLKYRSMPASWVKRKRQPAPLWLAAALALLAVGLSIQIVRQRSTIGRLSEPLIDLAYQEVRFQPASRGALRLEIPRRASHVQIGMVLVGQPAYPRYRIELLKPNGDEIYRSPELAAADSYTFTFRVEQIDQPSIRFRLFGLRDGQSFLLDEQRATIERSP